VVVKVGAFGVEGASDGKFCHNTVDAYMQIQSHEGIYDLSSANKGRVGWEGGCVGSP